MRFLYWLSLLQVSYAFTLRGYYEGFIGKQSVYFEFYPDYWFESYDFVDHVKVKGEFFVRDDFLELLYTGKSKISYRLTYPVGHSLFLERDDMIIHLEKVLGEQDVCVDTLVRCRRGLKCSSISQTCEY